MFFTLRSRHEISVPCMFKIMPILHTLCQQLLMLKIPLHRQTTSHYREEETINYWASLDCLHDTLECWNIQTKYFSGYFSQLPQVSPSRVENGVILNNLSSHTTFRLYTVQTFTLKPDSVLTKKIIYITIFFMSEPSCFPLHLFKFLLLKERVWNDINHAFLCVQLVSSILLTKIRKLYALETGA